MNEKRWLVTPGGIYEADAIEAAFLGGGEEGKTLCVQTGGVTYVTLEDIPVDKSADVLHWVVRWLTEGETGNLRISPSDWEKAGE